MGTPMRVPLQTWINIQLDMGELSGGIREQLIFVRDALASAVIKTNVEYSLFKASLVVINEHTSKSVRLPVYQFTLPNGAVVTMRDNFHNWKVSVDSPSDVTANFMGLFDPEERIHGVYCEGFPEQLVYGPYSENRRQFTIMLGSDYEVYTFFWLLTRQ